MARIPRFKVTKTSRGWCVNLPATLSDSGRRERLYHVSKEKALETAAGFREKHRQHGERATLIGPSLAEEALRCSERLAAVGATLKDATDSFLARWAAESASVTLREAATLWLDAKATRRPTTRKSYHYTLRKLDGLMGKRVAAITAAEIEAALGDGGPTARRMHLRNVRALWRWAERKGWADAGVVARIDLPDPPESGDVTVLVPAQVRKLLEVAETHYPETAPGFAVAVFAGLRSSELAQLTWVDVGPDGIEVSSRVSKTRRRRVVPVSPTLAAWLQAYRQADAEAPICAPNWRSKSQAVRRLAGWRVVAPLLALDRKTPPKLPKAAPAWPANVLRHTHASIEIALGRPLTELVFAFGHSGGTEVLQRHYFGRLSRREAIEILTIGPRGEELPTVAVA